MTNSEDTSSRDEFERSTLAFAFHDMSLLARLQFVRNIIFSRGGCKDDVEYDPLLVIAYKVVDDAVALVAEHPPVAALGSREPRESKPSTPGPGSG